jgi:hypothetical protein
MLLAALPKPAAGAARTLASAWRGAEWHYVTPPYIMVADQFMLL